MKIDGVDFTFSSERHKSFPIRISLNRDITLKETNYYCNNQS